MDDKDGKGDIDLPVTLRGEGERIRLAAVRPYPGQQAIRAQFSAEDLKHLLLQVGSDHKAVIAHTFCKFPGKEPRAAAKVEDPVAGFHVLLGKPVGAVEEMPERGVEVGGVLSGENFVVFVGFFAGDHYGMLRGGGDMGCGGNSDLKSEFFTFTERAPIKYISKD